MNEPLEQEATPTPREEFDADQTWDLKNIPEFDPDATWPLISSDR